MPLATTHLPPQEAIHRLWRLHDPHDVGPSPPKNSHQDDHGAEVRIQDPRIQYAVGSHYKHQGLFTTLDRFQILLADRGISTSEAEKTMAAGAQMWQSEMFTEDC